MKKKTRDRAGKQGTEEQAAPAPKSRGFSHGLELLGNMMRGKTLAFVVRDQDLELESAPLRYGLFMEAEASKESRVIGYADFFDLEPPRADVLVLRSERNLPFGPLRSSLEAFREKNPHAVVVAYAYAGTSELMLPLVAEGLIHSIHSDISLNDPDILRVAAKIMERMKQG